MNPEAMRNQNVMNQLSQVRIDPGRLMPLDRHKH
jgi:hypothetical protein